MRDRIELALAAWGHHVFRHAWWSVSAFVLIMTAFVSQLPKIQVDTSTEGFLKRNDPVRIAYADFRNEFGRDEQAIIAIRTDAIFDLDFLAKLRSLHEEIESEVPKLVEVQSLLNARNTHGVEEGLVVEDLLEDWPQSAADVAAVRERALANPLYTGMLFSADETLTTILIKTETYSSLGQSEDDALGGFDADDAKDASGNPPPFLTGDENSEIVLALQSVIHRHQAPDFEIFLSGSPIMMHTLQRMMTNDMKKFTVLCIAMIAAVLSVLFRRVAGVVIPLVVAVSSLVATISFMAIAGLTVTLPVQILPPFMLAVGVGGTIHVLAIFFQARHAEKSKQDAVAHALGHSGLAIIMTSLTTAGGLISFAAADLAPIASFGVAATVGVFISLGFTLGLVPALIALLPMQSARTAGG